MIASVAVEDISEIHRTEPYVYSQMVAGKDAKFYGEAKNSRNTVSHLPDNDYVRDHCFADQWAADI